MYRNQIEASVVLFFVFFLVFFFYQKVVIVVKDNHYMTLKSKACRFELFVFWYILHRMLSTYTIQDTDCHGKILIIIEVTQKMKPRRSTCTLNLIA